MEKYESLKIILFGRDPLAEVIKPEELRNLIFNKDNISSLWGVLPLAPLHFHIDRLVIKQWDLLQAGFKHYVLIADVHAILEKPDLDFEEISLRSRYYEHYLKYAAGLKDAIFIRGSSFQLREDYLKILYKASSLYKIDKIVKKGLPEDIASTEKATTSNLLHMLMQSIDHLFIEREKGSVDVVYGALSQRRTYVFSRDLVKKLSNIVKSSSSLKKPVILLSHLTHDIEGKELSKSSIKTRLNIHDEPAILCKKIEKMYAPRFEIDNNPLVELYLYSILPWFDEIELRTENMGRIILKKSDRELFIQLYKMGELHPRILKEEACRFMEQRLEQISRVFDSKPELLSWLDMSRFKNP